MWNFLHLPPLGHETALHIDLASAFIALLALIFSIWTWRHQNRMRTRFLLAQRDSGLIQWIESTIDTVVEIEFFLRSWASEEDATKYSIGRSEHLANLAAAIDKGRLYFPNFKRDVIVAQGEPAAHFVPVGRKRRQAKRQLMLLDDLAEIYDLTNKIDFKSEETVRKTQREVMMKKREFITLAQSEVEFRRVPGIIE